MVISETFALPCVVTEEIPNCCAADAADANDTAAVADDDAAVIDFASADADAAHRPP